MELLDTAHRLSRKGVIIIPRPERTGSSLTVDMKAGEIREAVLYIERNPKTRAGDLHAVNPDSDLYVFGYVSGIKVEGFRGPDRKDRPLSVGD